MTTGFRVLMVCTANMCRSPMAQHLLRHAVAQRSGAGMGLGWEVQSAGTHVLPGMAMHPIAREILAERGLPVAAQPSVQATPSMIEDVDLILTSTRSQRAWVVQTDPRATRRTYTIRQFTRLCIAGLVQRDGERVTSGSELLELATLGRVGSQPVTEDQDDVADPNGGGTDQFRGCADLIDSCLEQILAAL